MARRVAALARLAKSRLAVARRPLAALGAPLGRALCSLRQAPDTARDRAAQVSVSEAPTVHGPPYCGFEGAGSAAGFAGIGFGGSAEPNGISTPKVMPAEP